MTRDQFYRAYDKHFAKLGSQRAVAKKMGIPRTTIQDWLKVRDAMPAPTTPAAPMIVKLPRGKRAVKRFIFSSAQDDTPVHRAFLDNLQAYGDHLNAFVYVSGYTYNKRLFGDHSKLSDSARYDSAIAGLLLNKRVEIGNNLVWLGDMNTLPTAVSPLAGFETHTQQKWGIVPHAKVQLVSVPTLKHQPAKQLLTTGSLTVPNYVQKRAGIRAHWHHQIGAVLVEIDGEGRQFARHLLASGDYGSFQDLTTRVADGEVSDGHRVHAITWGDIHAERIDEMVALGAFGLDAHDSFKLERTGTSMLDWMMPQYQFFHDVLDFFQRNHHNIDDPHFRIKMAVNGTEKVEDGIRKVAQFLFQTQRHWCKSVVVASNHDAALTKWLKTADWRADPINAEFWLRAQLAAVQALHANDTSFHPLQWATNQFGLNLDDVHFLKPDESFVIHSGIECGMHGHLGANGAKGSPRAFTVAGPKANLGHAHSPSICDGIFTAGTCSQMDMGYNAGLSSWAPSHIVTYPNGKRTIVTMQGDRFCAE